MFLVLLAAYLACLLFSILVPYPWVTWFLVLPLKPLTFADPIIILGKLVATVAFPLAWIQQMDQETDVRFQCFVFGILALWATQVYFFGCSLFVYHLWAGYLLLTLYARWRHLVHQSILDH